MSPTLGVSLHVCQNAAAMAVAVIRIRLTVSRPFLPTFSLVSKSSSHPKLNLRTQRKYTLWGQVRAFSNTFSMSVDWWSKWTIKWSLVSRSSADTSACPSYKCIVSINMKITKAKTGKGSGKAALILSHRCHHWESCFSHSEFMTQKHIWPPRKNYKAHTAFNLFCYFIMLLC